MFSTYNDRHARWMYNAYRLVQQISKDTPLSQYGQLCSSANFIHLLSQFNISPHIIDMLVRSSSLGQYQYYDCIRTLLNTCTRLQQAVTSLMCQAETMADLMHLLPLILTINTLHTTPTNTLYILIKQDQAHVLQLHPHIITNLCYLFCKPTHISHIPLHHVLVQILVEDTQQLLLLN